MRTKYFFQCCKDMRNWWDVAISSDGIISVFKFDGELAEMPITYWNPICAVANEVVGFRPVWADDEYRAASALKLSQEFTNLVFVASIAETRLAPLVKEVREELIDSFTHPWNEPPSPNRLEKKYGRLLIK